MSIKTIVIISLIGVWLIINTLVGLRRSAKQMRYVFIDGQNVVGIIFTNVFFSFAWLIQLIKGLFKVSNQRSFKEVK